MSRIVSTILVLAGMLLLSACSDNSSPAQKDAERTQERPTVVERQPEAAPEPYAPEPAPPETQPPAPEYRVVHYAPSGKVLGVFRVFSYEISGNGCISFTTTVDPERVGYVCGPAFAGALDGEERALSQVTAAGEGDLGTTEYVVKLFASSGNVIHQINAVSIEMNGTCVSFTTADAAYINQIVCGTISALPAPR